MKTHLAFHEFVVFLLVRPLAESARVSIRSLLPPTPVNDSASHLHTKAVLARCTGTNGTMFENQIENGREKKQITSKHTKSYCLLSSRTQNKQNGFIARPKSRQNTMVKNTTVTKGDQTVSHPNAKQTKRVHSKAKQPHKTLQRHTDSHVHTSSVCSWHIGVFKSECCWLRAAC